MTDEPSYVRPGHLAGTDQGSNLAQMAARGRGGNARWAALVDTAAPVVGLGRSGRP